MSARCRRTALGRTHLEAVGEAGQLTRHHHLGLGVQLHLDPSVRDVPPDLDPVAEHVAQDIDDDRGRCAVAPGPARAARPPSSRWSARPRPGRSRRGASTGSAGEPQRPHAVHPERALAGVGSATRYQVLFLTTSPSGCTVRDETRPSRPR